MAKSSQRSAVTAMIGAVAAVIFFIVCIVICAATSDSMPKLEPDKYMTMTKMDVTVVWKEDRSCHITQKLTASFHADEDDHYETTHGIYIDIPVNSGEKIRDLKVSNVTPTRPYEVSHESFNNIVRIAVGDEYQTFKKDSTLSLTVEYDCITPKHKDGPDVLAFMPIGKGWICDMRDAKVTMIFPAAPEQISKPYGIWVCDKDVTTGGAVMWSQDRKTVTVLAGALPAFKGVEIAVKMPDGTMTPYSDGAYLVTLIVGIVLLAAAILIKLLAAKNKPLTPIVDYYPPRVPDTTTDYFDEPPKSKSKGVKLDIKRMLPVQLGKIIDDSCSPQDVTSLIFYWASKGFISIEEKEDGVIHLIKESPLDPVTDYEKKLFDRLFASARSTGESKKPEVSVDSLSGSFANSINNCRSSVNSEFAGKFYSRGFTVLSLTFTVLCAVSAVLLAFFSTLRISMFFFNPLGVAAAIPAVVMAIIGNSIVKFYFKLKTSTRRLIAVGYVVLALLLSFGVSMVIPIDATTWLERILFTVFVAGTSAVAPFLRVRTQEYNEQLNAIIGFRNFLRDAEKDRLEALIKDDPQYYYDILPYANVLGVSDVWEDKFKGLTIEPPKYYTSSRSITFFDYMILHNLTRSVSTKLTYTPPKVNSRSFSSVFGSGGGGGGGGGGFSGGSFGGGGGGRW